LNDFEHSYSPSLKRQIDLRGQSDSG